MRNLMEGNNNYQDINQNNMQFNNFQNNNKFVNYDNNNNNSNINYNNFGNNSNNYNDKSNNKKIKLVIMVLVILIIVAAIVFIVINKLNPKEEPEVCTGINIASTMTIGSKTTIKNDKDKEFIISSSSEAFSQLEMAQYANNLSDVELKLCYKVIDKENVVERFEFINSESKMKYKSTTKDDLLEEAGYHKAGTYKETALLASIDQNPGYGSENGTQYMYYKIKFKMNNGKIIEMQFRVYNGIPFDFKGFKTSQMYTVDYRIDDNKDLSELNYVLLNMQ